MDTMGSISNLSVIEEDTDAKYFESTSNISSVCSQRETSLTILKKSKVEAELSKKLTAASQSVFAVVVKWIVTVVATLCILVSLSANKISVIRLTQSLRNSTNNSVDAESRKKATQLYLMIMMTVLVPYTVNLLRAVWFGLFRKDLLWPKKKAVFLTLFTSVLEPLGLCLFLYKILASYREVTSVLLLGTFLPLAFIPVIIGSWKNTLSQYKLVKIAAVFGLILQLVGLGITGYITWHEPDKPGKTFIWHVPVAIFCVVFAWCPAIQSAMTESNVEEEKEEEGKQHAGSLSNTTSTQQSSVFGSVDSSRTNLVRNETRRCTHYKKSTWKTSFISHLVKIPAFLIFSFVIFYFDGSIYSSGLTQNTLSEFKAAWSSWIADSEFPYFLVNIITSVAGYHLAFLACHSSMQKVGFTLPTLLSFPTCFLLLYVTDSCKVFMDSLSDCTYYEPYWLVIIAMLTVTVGAVFSSAWLVFRTDHILLQAETQMFWLPSFNGVCLDHWLLLNRRIPDDTPIKHKPRTGRVYICTTMYRETTNEMRQVLESINRINEAREAGSRFFESHVILDCGVRNREFSSFALQLISLLESTLGINPGDCTKIITPYGMRLNWKLPEQNKVKKPMFFNVHLKDNLKVKNKKRWSQVMYMSYVLDFLKNDAEDEESFILTTDADVEFTADSVEALLDLMTRDTTVGAVCARTHPMGSGPLVWYQIFEYAIGHWFQKAAEHVLGSVLCSPGCFSVYRCKALRDILPTYASGVEHAFQFLTKDMGEDRWLCTLLVQSGWRIEYCAASENSTNCPDEFGEFYKQRRRWIASTIANLILIIKEWKVISHFNHRVSFLFILYQGLLLFSTLVSPSTVILVVSGGLTFAWHINPVSSIVLQILVSLIFVVSCLYSSDKTQIMTAKLITFLYAVIMSAVAVGTVEQMVEEIGKSEQVIDFNHGISVATFYFICLAAMFILAAILHPREFLCLIHALWYLLCLPSGYLVLNLYSICNITDRSWGTREDKIESSISKQSWQSKLKYWFTKICFLCFAKDSEKTPMFDAEVQTMSTPIHSSVSSDPAPHTSQDDPDQVEKSQSLTGTAKDAEQSDDSMDDTEDDDDIGDASPVAVEDWLPVEFKVKYAQTFKHHGFDNTLFISGMNSKELKDIGITTKTHKQFILDQINSLPTFEIEYHVPTSVKEWLDAIGLPMYQETFRQSHIHRPKDLSILKTFGRKEVEKELKITKAGHVKRLLYAIQKLRNPTEGEKMAMEMKNIIDASPTHYLKHFNIGEYDFWQRLRNECLKPGTKAFGLEEELKVKLAELRNSWLLIFAVCNTLWLILITTLASKGNLTVLGANPVGLSFIIIFGSLFLTQFLAMFVHRFNTAVHYVARAPYKCGARFETAWSFHDDNVDGDAVDADDKQCSVLTRYEKARFRRSKDVKHSVSETTPLLV